MKHQHIQRCNETSAGQSDVKLLLYETPSKNKNPYILNITKSVSRLWIVKAANFKITMSGMYNPQSMGKTIIVKHYENILFTID